MMVILPCMVKPRKSRRNGNENNLFKSLKLTIVSLILATQFGGCLFTAEKRADKETPEKIRQNFAQYGRFMDYYFLPSRAAGYIVYWISEETGKHNQYDRIMPINPGDPRR